jgi:hypothetical protein
MQGALLGALNLTTNKIEADHSQYVYELIASP